MIDQTTLARVNLNALLLVACAKRLPDFDPQADGGKRETIQFSGRRVSARLRLAIGWTSHQNSRPGAGRCLH